MRLERPLDSCYALLARESTPNPSLINGGLMGVSNSLGIQQGRQGLGSAAALRERQLSGKPAPGAARQRLAKKRLYRDTRIRFLVRSGPSLANPPQAPYTSALARLVLRFSELPQDVRADS